jgi:hypothetical protein
VGKGWGSGMTKIRWKEGARVAVAAFAVAAMGVETAAGADMIRKPAPGPAAPVINWTGCYIGATLGWGLGNLWRSTDLNLYNPANVNPWEFSLNSSALGGGTAVQLAAESLVCCRRGGRRRISEPVAACAAGAVI